MTPMTALVGLLVFAGASFFFALAESSLFALGKWQVRQLSDRSPAGAKVNRLLSEPQDLLATIVLGNTFANGAMIATVLWVALYQRWEMAFSLAALLIFLLFGAEVAPKTLAVRAPEFWALRVAPPMLILQMIFRPFHRVAQKANATVLSLLAAKTATPIAGITDEEYQELLELAYQQGALARSEKEIILQIISLDRRTVKDVMKPRSTMACIPDDLSVEEMVEAARKFKHTRLPMYDENPDTIVGILNTRVLLLDPDVDLADAIEFPSFVPDSMNLLQLLKSLQRQQRGLAIVLDEFGGTSGIVTVEDILEEVVGEIRKEGVSTAFVMENLSEHRWRLSGTMRIDDFARELPQLGDVNGVDTMGGLMARELSRIPDQGEFILFRGLRLTAHAVDERRIKELLVEVVKRR